MAVLLAIGGNGSKRAYFSHSAGTAHGAPPLARVPHWPGHRMGQGIAVAGMVGHASCKVHPGADPCWQGQVLVALVRPRPWQPPEC